MNTRIVVKRATDRDLSAIANINSKVFLGDRDDLESARAWTDCNFRAFPMYQYFVVKVRGTLAGYSGWQIHGGFHRAEPVIELDQIGIARSHQGQGLADILIEDCFRELTDWMQAKNDRIESHISFVVWAYTLNFNAISVYARQFGDGICGHRVQFGNRAESMLRRRYPIIRRVRDE